MRVSSFRNSSRPVLVISFLLAMGASAPAGAVNYFYDALDRLKFVQYPDGKVITYTYDNVGNRTSRSVTTGFSLENDLDGDGKADILVWRPSDGRCYVLLSGGGVIVRQWGVSGDVPVAGGYDGDRRTDYAVWRPSNGKWYVLKSSGGESVVQWGTSGGVP